jgi:hypothetical protein
MRIFYDGEYWIFFLFIYSVRLLSYRCASRFCFEVVFAVIAFSALKLKVYYELSDYATAFNTIRLLFIKLNYI